MLDKVRLPEASPLAQDEIGDDLLRLEEGFDASPILNIIARQPITGGPIVAAHLDHEVCKRAGGSKLSSLATFGCIEALHQASLIRDDLIDWMPSRRDNPSIWADYCDVAGSAAGDSLIAVAHGSQNAQDLELVVRSRRLLPWRRVNRPTKSRPSDLYQTVSSVWYRPLGQRLGAVHGAVSAKIRGQCADLVAGFSRSAQEYGAEPVLIAQPNERPADIADIFAAYCWIASLKPGALLSLGTELAMAGRELAEAANRTGLASSNLAIGYQVLDDCADLSDDLPSGRPARNLCLLLKEIGDLTPAEAMETALMHAEHALGRAANGAAGIPDEIGILTARLCLCKPRETKVLLDAV
jgi:geranylgeranyl pyrophosphate synthase